ncbi:hypothetical protein KII73_06940 [Helicobacter pylori]|uniref:hypothetical protein n=2 Tax=Helicobacter pylori TaxID=210 RepID=UPI001F100882|nr:hypothetical protein [Helicobacter pylori]MCH4614746.1 hypothetical protein [Helicobacter pylori]
MPNTTNKDYTKYSQRQLFNLMNKKEQEIEKLKRDRAYLEKKMAKELEKRDQNFKDKIDALNELLQKISQAFDDKRDCCFGHEIPNIQTQQAMMDALKDENLETIEDFSAWANEVKKEMNAEN